jgi:PPOX class probable F420-dependent enzyme
MSATVPESHSDLLLDEKRALAILATIMDDGSPQATPIWFDIEGDTLCFNTARGRVKDRNISARPRVAVVIVDPDDPYRYLQLRGSVESSSTEGAREHIDRLAQKYLGTPSYDSYQGETRVTYCIRIESVDTMG